MSVAVWATCPDHGSVQVTPHSVDVLSTQGVAVVRCDGHWFEVEVDDWKTSYLLAVGCNVLADVDWSPNE